MVAHAQFAKISCGCETAQGRLVSVCALHGNYLRQNLEAARQERPIVDQELYRRLVIELAPIVVSEALKMPGCTEAMTASKLHDQVHEIVRRMDG